MVVPGYFALYLTQPMTIVLSLLTAAATYFIVHLLSTFIIIYGKRRTVLMILVAYLLRMGIDSVGIGAIQAVPGFASFEWEIVGYIIPGLVAIWMDRQGLVETVSSLLAASVVVRLILILTLGNQLDTIL